MILEWLFRAGFVALATAIFLTLTVLALMGVSEGWDYAKGLFANKSYARMVFGDLVPYDAVLDSQKHGGLFNRCTSVVVEPSTEAPATPPTRTGRPFRANFGGEWKPGPSQWLLAEYGTPVVDLSGRDPMVGCAQKNWNAKIYARVRAAARDDGTWWTEHGGAQLYSKAHRLAVLVYWRPM
ncbi:hypothetical protein [Defluviimonas sp. SAOS-178_SWC]|uniref:hypothetical protein n=1 Tax=Defluviimonas sp. SAOS-178_SWC TaxID=3121287 RepID=UPI0032221219